MIIKPIPVVNIAYPNHITGRYRPVLVTTTPETADSTAAPRENGSILRNNQPDSPTAASKLTLYQLRLRRPQELGNKGEDNMHP